MTYRIGFRFEPHVERMGGRAKGGTLYRQKCGAWRVVCSSQAFPSNGLPPVFTDDGMLYVLSPEPIRPGSFKSPRIVLESYFNKRA